MKIKVSFGFAGLGLILGIFGFVRSGGLVFAIGGACASYFRYQDSGSKRKIELLIPLALAFALFVVALTLPHGK